MFNKIIATATIRFIVTVAIVVYKGLTPVVYRMLTVYWQVPEFMLWDLFVICKRKSRNLKRLRLLRWLSVGYRPPATGRSRKLNE